MVDKDKLFIEKSENSNCNLEGSEEMANDINSQILGIKKIVSESSRLDFRVVSYLQTTFEDWDKAVTNFCHQVDSFSDEKDFYFLKSKMKDHSFSAKNKIAHAMSLGKALEAKSKWGKSTENDVSQLLNALNQLNEDITSCVKYFKRAMDLTYK